MIMKTTSRLNSMRVITLAITSLLLLAGCQRDTDYISGQDAAANIYLTAVTEQSIVTRVPYEYTEPNESEAGVLRASVWASSAQFTYLNTGENGRNDSGKVAIYTTATFDSPAPQLLNQAVYPKSGTPVYFVGLYPQSGWSNNGDGKSALYQFNGSQDVMFAPRIEGKYADTSDPNNLVFDVPILYFKHMLTWLRIKIVADDETTRDAWGKITQINITSHNNIAVALDYSDAAGFVVADDVEYSSLGNDGVLPIYQTGTNDVFPKAGGYTLPYYPSVSKPQEVAYVMCSPVMAVATVVDALGKEVPQHEYTINIETERRRVSLPIDLRVNDTQYFEGSTRGKCFTLNLTFKMGNTIVVSADVEDWMLGGSGVVEL